MIWTRLIDGEEHAGSEHHMIEFYLLPDRDDFKIECWINGKEGVIMFKKTREEAREWAEKYSKRLLIEIQSMLNGGLRYHEN